MKGKIRKWIKQGRAFGVLLVLAVLALAVYGSYGAYTNFDSVKRVVSTKESESDIMFSSNYLSQLNLSDKNYPVKRISLSENDETCTFTVLVCNYVWGDETRYNPKDIEFDITAQLFSMNGGTLPDKITEIKINNQTFDSNGKCILEKQKLSSGKANSLPYKFEIPADLKDKVKFQIIVMPSDESKAAVNSRQLAAILSFAEYKVNKNWTGHFIDAKTKDPDSYDAFNYEISGNGAGTVTIKWGNTLQLSKWVTDGKQDSYSFKVDDATTAIQFQFYRNPKVPLEFNETDQAAKWSELEKLVEVTFTEKKVEENGNT